MQLVATNMGRSRNVINTAKYNGSLHKPRQCLDLMWVRARAGAAIDHGDTTGGSADLEENPMKFNIRTNGRPVDLASVEQALLSADPAGMVDLDGLNNVLRVSTYLDGAGLQSLITDAGFSVPLGDVEQMPSECCGGCGG